VATSFGKVITFGDFTDSGDASGTTLAKPWWGWTRVRRGYYLVAPTAASSASVGPVPRVDRRHRAQQAMVGMAVTPSARLLTVRPTAHLLLGDARSTGRWVAGRSTSDGGDGGGPSGQGTGRWRPTRHLLLRRRAVLRVDGGRHSTSRSSACPTPPASVLVGGGRRRRLLLRRRPIPRIDRCHRAQPAIVGMATLRPARATAGGPDGGSSLRPPFFGSAA